MMAKDSEKRKLKRGPLLLPIIYTMHAVSREGYITNLSAGGGAAFTVTLLFQ